MGAHNDRTPIAVLDTGGTINGILSEHDPAPARSLVIDFLLEHGASYGIAVAASEQVVMKDSRALTRSDREALLDAVKAADHQRILVPHGTFTMPQTGEYLDQNLGRGHGRCIVLVGARKPLNDPDTDAFDRLNFALAALCEGPAGVWVAMADRLWRPSSVIKNPETGEFVARDA